METIILFIKTTTNGSKSLLQVAKTKPICTNVSFYYHPAAL